MSAPFLIVFLCVCLYHKDMEIVTDKEIKKIKPLLIFFHFPLVWPAHRQQMCSPFCSSVQLPSTQSICWCLCVARHWCGVGVPWASWWWGSLSAVASVPHWDKASQKCWWTVCASSSCSPCTCFRSFCLLNCNPHSLLSQDYHCIFVEASCEPKSTAVTKSAAGPVQPMSVIPVISLWRDDVNFVFPIQILLTAKSRIQDSEVQSTVLHCKPHVHACLLFLNYNICFTDITHWLVCCNLVAII